MHCAANEYCVTHSDTVYSLWPLQLTRSQDQPITVYTCAHGQIHTYWCAHTVIYWHATQSRAVILSKLQRVPHNAGVMFWLGEKWGLKEAGSTWLVSTLWLPQPEWWQNWSSSLLSLFFCFSDHSSDESQTNNLDSQRRQLQTIPIMCPYAPLSESKERKKYFL